MEERKTTTEQTCQLSYRLKQDAEKKGEMTKAEYRHVLSHRDSQQRGATHRGFPVSMNGFAYQSPELLSAAAAAAVCVRMCVVMPMSMDYIITERRRGLGEW